jgi:molybdate transport system substrate-binding protein
MPARVTPPRLVLAFVSLALAAVAGAAQAATVHAAVAANFTRVAEQIGADFKAATGHDVVFSFGATGTLYTQITQAAPFDVFLSADDKRTAAAIADGFGVAGTDFTYAIGRLVLYSPIIDMTDGAAVLAAGAFRHIAIADPQTAPYGAAATAVLEKLGLTAALAAKIVTGENITQTLQFMESGSAELGFVALSQVIGKPPTQVWLVAQHAHPPIRQNAVLLKPGEANEAAKAFLEFLKSDSAHKVIKAAGYAVE